MAKIFNSKDITSKENNLTDNQLRFKNGRNFTFMGIYNPAMPKILDLINVNPDEQYNIEVIYAADCLKDGIKDFFGSDEGKLCFENKQKSFDGVIEWHKKLTNPVNICLDVREYVQLPLFGLSFIDREKENGFIHVSNFLKGVLPKDTPYIEACANDDKDGLFSLYKDYMLRFVKMKTNQLAYHKPANEK